MFQFQTFLYRIYQNRLRQQHLKNIDAVNLSRAKGKLLFKRKNPILLNMVGFCSRRFLGEFAYYMFGDFKEKPRSERNICIPSL